MVWNPVFTETALLPTLRWALIGINLTSYPSQSKVRVIVVEKEKPLGQRCRYCKTVSLLNALNPEFKSGILALDR
jgi:hypothetical protein